MQISLPKIINKYFWGDNLDELNWQNHHTYITKTLLEKGDKEAIKWLLSIVKKSELLKQLPKLKLSSKSNNFWQIYLSA